jgi:hypothetical protein
MNQRFFAILAMLTSLLLIYSGEAVAGKILYDDFSSAYINSSKWRQRTIVREIVDGQYVSKLGNRSPGMGAEFAPGLFMNSLYFANPDSINSVKCDITITESQLDSALGSQSYARILGLFYNTNPSGGGTGDITAEVGIGDRGNGGLEVFGIVAEILDDDYQSWRIIDTVTVIGPIQNVTFPITYNLQLIYNGSNGFEFWANDNSKSLTGPERKASPFGKTKSLETVIKATNGSNNGYISAKFDNVYINNQTTVYDDFSSDLIDPAKWEDNEKVRESPSGYLRANIIGYGSTRTVNTVLTEKNAPYLEAKVRIDSSTQLSNGAWGVGRIQGYYFNDTQPPGEDTKYKGDYFVTVRLRYNSDNTLSANVFIDRSDDENQDVMYRIYSHQFSTTINLDTYYTLSIRFVEKERKFIFGCNSETLQWVIPSEITTIYPAYGEHRLLRSRVDLDDGETGFINVRFDDVYIEEKGKFNPSIPLLLLNE